MLMDGKKLYQMLNHNLICIYYCIGFCAYFFLIKTSIYVLCGLTYSKDGYLKAKKIRTYNYYTPNMLCQNIHSIYL